MTTERAARWRNATAAGFLQWQGGGMEEMPPVGGWGWRGGDVEEGEASEDRSNGQVGIRPGDPCGFLQFVPSTFSLLHDGQPDVVTFRASQRQVRLPDTSTSPNARAHTATVTVEIIFNKFSDRCYSILGIQ
jgi:hypothetical protein